MLNKVKFVVWNYDFAGFVDEFDNYHDAKNLYDKITFNNNDDIELLTAVYIDNKFVELADTLLSNKNIFINGLQTITMIKDVGYTQTDENDNIIIDGEWLHDLQAIYSYDSELLYMLINRNIYYVTTEFDNEYIQMLIDEDDYTDVIEMLVSKAIEMFT